MKVEVIEEAHINTAMYGTLLSFGVTSNVGYYEFLNSRDLLIQGRNILNKLAGLKGGHDEFLKHITVSLVVDMPLYWWTHQDQYSYAPDLSESKMHTLIKRPLTSEDFSPGVHPDAIKLVNDLITEKKFQESLENLPFGFLQKRVITTNYMCLRNIYQQRKSHKLTDWRWFVDEIKSQLDHPEYLEVKHSSKTTKKKRYNAPKVLAGQADCILCDTPVKKD